MKKYLGISLSIGLVAGLWFFVANLLGAQPWPAYIGWSIFFWEGGDVKAMKRSFPCIVLGAVLGVITFYGISTLPEGSLQLPVACVMVALLAFTMAYAQSVSLFQVASATFIGASHYFGLRGYLGATEAFINAAFVTSVGLILGILSVNIAPVFDRWIQGKRGA